MSTFVILALVLTLVFSSTVSVFAAYKDGTYRVSFSCEGADGSSGIESLSVTVIGDEGRLCDALSTSLFVMGIDKAEQLWKKHQNFDFIAVSESGDIYITEGIENYFELSDSYKGLNVSVIR